MENHFNQNSENAQESSKHHLQAGQHVQVKSARIHKFLRGLQLLRGAPLQPLHTGPRDREIPLTFSHEPIHKALVPLPSPQRGAPAKYHKRAKTAASRQPHLTATSATGLQGRTVPGDLKHVLADCTTGRGLRGRGQAPLRAGRERKCAGGRGRAQYR